MGKMQVVVLQYMLLHPVSEKCRANREVFEIKYRISGNLSTDKAVLPFH